MIKVQPEKYRPSQAFLKSDWKMEPESVIFKAKELFCIQCPGRTPSASIFFIYFISCLTGAICSEDAYLGF